MSKSLEPHLGRFVCSDDLLIIQMIRHCPVNILFVSPEQPDTANLVVVPTSKHLATLTFTQFKELFLSVNPNVQFASEYPIFEYFDWDDNKWRFVYSPKDVANEEEANTAVRCFEMIYEINAKQMDVTNVKVRVQPSSLQAVSS